MPGRLIDAVRAAAFAGGLLLAGCTAPPPPAPPPSPTASIDGAYAGTASGSCGANQPVRMEVSNGTFTLSVGTSLSLQGDAGPDGTLSASKPGERGRDMNFNGRIDGSEVRGGSYDGRCSYAFALTRLGEPAGRPPPRS